MHANVDYSDRPGSKIEYRDHNSSLARKAIFHTTPTPGRSHSFKIEEIGALNRDHSSMWCLRIPWWKNYVTELGLEVETLQEELDGAKAEITQLRETLDKSHEHYSENCVAFERDKEASMDEANRLRGLLEDAQSQIFSLQPYLKELTPREAAQDYGYLCDSVQDCIASLSGHCWEDEGAQKRLLSQAHHQPEQLQNFQKEIQSSADLFYMSTLSETDEDVAVAISMQFLVDRVFGSSLYGAVPQHSTILQSIIHSMGDYCSPIRDEYSTRAWSAEAWSAILAHPEYRTARENRCNVLADHLFDRIAILCPQDKAEAFKGGLLEKCIKPAVALCEKIHTSLHKFHLEGSSLLFFEHGKKLRYLENFYASPDNMICINVLQNRKTLHLSKESSAHSERNSQRQLQPVGAVLPALYLQKAQRNENDPQEPIVVCKQKVLVAYGSSAEWKRYEDAVERTLVSKLLAIRIGI